MIKKEYTIIENLLDLDKAIKHIEESEYLTYDTETTGLNVRKDRIIGFSFCGKAGIAFYFPLLYWDVADQEIYTYNADMAGHGVDLIRRLKEKQLLMWNGSFDIRITKNNLKVDLLESLIAEGVLLKHTVAEDGSFALKEVAVLLQKEIGYDAEEVANQEQIELKENIKKNGGSVTKNNYELYKADVPVIGKYACADADMTLRVCEYYKNKIIDEDLFEFFFYDEVMPLYKEVTIPMEDRGVKLDLDLINQTDYEIKKDIAQLEKDIIEQLMSDPASERWYKDKVNSSYQAKPTGKFVQMYIELCNLDFPKSEKTGKYSVTKKEKDRFKDTVHGDFLIDGIIDEEKAFIVKNKLYLTENDGLPIQISSKKKMGEIVFDYMGISPLSTTDKGNPQFNDDMVDHLAKEGISWAKSFHNYNKLNKVKSSYIDRFLQAQEDGYYYFSYKQHGTISGRYGSDAQQLPRPLEEGQEDEIVSKYVNRVRAFFVSESGRIFVDNDYESLEPHVFAHVSNEDSLRDIFRKGHDFYSTIAIATEGLHQYSADKKSDIYLGAKDKPKRQSAKAYSLGIPYGMSGYALAMALGIPVPDGEKLVEKYLNAYPNLDDWMKETKTFVQKNGYIRSQVGRVRHLPAVKNLYKKYGDKLLDWRFRAKLAKQLGGGKENAEIVKNMYRDYKNGVNNSRNFCIQSLAASIVNRSAIAVTRRFKELGVDAWCCAQIHDQLIFNVPVDQKDQCAEIIQDLMENTVKLSLVLKAPPSMATNWRDGH